MDRLEKSFKTLRPKGGDGDGPVFPTKGLHLFRAQLFFLVENQQPRKAVQIQFGEDSFDGLDMFFKTGVAHIDQVNQQVRLLQLVKGRRKATIRSSGKSLINPTVSVMTQSCFTGNLSLLVAGSRVAKSLSSTWHWLW